VIIPLAEQRESSRFPIVTVSLIALNVMAFVAEMGMGDDVVKSFCYIPSHPSLLTSVTSMFLHGGFFHIVGNMLFLWIVGPNIEEAFTPLGMLALYLSAGVFADFAHGHMIPQEMMDTPTLGASGAIAGLMGASIVIFPRAKVTFFYWIFWFWSGTFELRAFWAIGLWFVEQLLLNAMDAGGGVAYGAHIGGFGISAVVAMALVLVHVVEPHWERPESWPQRPRPVRVTDPTVVAAQAAQRLKLAYGVCFGVLIAVLLGGTVKGAMAYRAWRASLLLHYAVVVPTSDSAAVEGEVKIAGAESVAARPHDTYERTPAKGYWLGLEMDSEAAVDQRDMLIGLRYPAVAETVGEGRSVVHLVKVFPTRAAAQHAEKALRSEAEA
jgi:membrane associated rhomboid family serine protease